MIKYERVFINLIITSIFVFFFDLFGFLGIFKKPLDPAVSAIKFDVLQKYQTFALYYRTVINISNLAQYQKDADHFKSQISDLEQKNKLLLEENIQLKNQLGANNSTSKKLQLANIVGISGTAEIDVGEENGISQGMSVILGSTFFGKIIKTSPSRSIVMLPNDPDSNIPAKSIRGVKGVVRGQGFEKILFDKVLQKDQLFLSDTVLTSGEGGYPPNLVIGNIDYINTDDVSPYKSAFLTASIDYKNSMIVFVVLSE
jgi:cell shape-determining protein MreC